MNDYQTTMTTEKFVVGVDTAWTVVDDTSGYEDNSCVSPGCQPYCFQGKNKIKDMLTCFMFCFIPVSASFLTFPNYFCLGVNTYVFTKYDKLTDSWEDIKTVDYWRGYYGNFASVVPLVSGVENWCMTEDQLKQGQPNMFQNGERSFISM